MNSGRSVRLYLVDGSSTGLLTAEIVNWTGHVLAGPRSRLDAALQRDELKRTGIYLLYGADFSTELPPVYVGEGDDISARLSAHARDGEKDYWDRFVAITSKDMNLTKAHVKFLEARLIDTLASVKKSDLKNKTVPSFDRLPEADIADMETFLTEVRLVLPVIGIDFARRPMVSSDAPKTEKVNSFKTANSRKGIDAKAQEIEGEFVVLKGSRGSLNEAPSFGEKSQTFRNQVISSGRANQIDDRHFQLTEDIAFTSPSAAAVFLFGTSRNGRTDWILEETGQTYGDWKDQQLGLGGVGHN